LKLIL